MGLGLCYSLVNIPYGSLATAMTQQPQSRARLGAARGIAASLTFVCLAFLIGPSIKNSSPEEMVSVYHFWTIVLVIAGMVLYFICFKSTRENVVRIVAQPSLKISLQTLKRNRPLFMLCIGALCVLISTFAVSASSLFYVRYVLNDTGLFTVLVLVQNLVGTVASAPLVPGMVARIGNKEYLPDWRFAGNLRLSAILLGFRLVTAGGVGCVGHRFNWSGRYYDCDVGTGS